MTKIQVPEDLQNKIWCRVCELHQESISAHTVKITVQAFAELLSEHPIVPTDEQIDTILRNCPTMQSASQWLAVEWQRRMFLAEPEIRTDIEDLLWSGIHIGTSIDAEHNSDVLEAFRRGQRSKG